MIQPGGGICEGSRAAGPMTIAGRVNASLLLRGLAAAAGIVLLGLICGRVAISHYGLSAAELLVAFPLLVFVTRRPLVAALLLLALLASALFYTALPRPHLTRHLPINFGDILLAAIIAATLWRKPWRVWPVPIRRLFVALAALLLLALIPTLALVTQGHAEARDAIAGYK